MRGSLNHGQLRVGRSSGSKDHLVPKTIYSVLKDGQRSCSSMVLRTTEPFGVEKTFKTIKANQKSSCKALFVPSSSLHQTPPCCRVLTGGSLQNRLGRKRDSLCFAPYKNPDGMFGVMQSIRFGFCFLLLFVFLMLQKEKCTLGLVVQPTNLCYFLCKGGD